MHPEKKHNNGESFVSQMEEKYFTINWNEKNKKFKNGCSKIFTTNVRDDCLMKSADLIGILKELAYFKHKIHRKK